MMQPERLIMGLNLVQNYISDNFNFDHEVVQSNPHFWYLVVPLLDKLVVTPQT